MRDGQPSSTTRSLSNEARPSRDGNVGAGLNEACTQCDKARQPGMHAEAHLGKDKPPADAIPARPYKLDNSANLLEGRDQLRESRRLRLNRLTSD
jgi:hypothetical protein